MKTLLLIDGNAIMHRAFHALPPFKTKDGTPTNIIYGFFSMLHKAVTDFKPSHIVVCFDTPKPTFRNRLFKKYQAQRPPLVDDFKSQIPLLKEALKKSGINYLEKDGYEADDIIGTLTKTAENKMKVLILTGDKDILQLVNKYNFVLAPQVGLSNIKLYDETEVKNKMSVSPAEIPDLKALTGDPSDNYPGAKGIGPKTAVKLIAEYNSVENLLKNLDKVDNEKVKTILAIEKENILLSKKLAQIVRDVPIEFNLKSAVFNWFKPALKGYFDKLEIKSLKIRIFAQKKPDKEKGVKKESRSQMELF
ncbi:hypothetical protein A2774_03745 [Candidatus Roizmanbacteria bacterium RIFCSPHIGHO2_01_FULL_39_12c]|uniref:5'-3' exonuclease domain-containing protein n=1 Tax=Candidatus Roizmanbacteria bacterium RIFCSPHIGHO2_01_FULL_39_12c TaxID=1802031 RepID=A0A1F7GEA8_9BACT|nr:MAG: hypothetical protein A2774_03745 [Candidatus Roizmanbacteria bacterium RIFCSPHIGHO2_01_FULL_39_12c]OGK47978.1 MAG: hypothetical protein A2963_00105 [Candidatus Roizmanbacteria bacterium RIFCSPLOWO2_01_FULL_40_13]